MIGAKNVSYFLKMDAAGLFTDAVIILEFVSK